MIERINDNAIFVIDDSFCNENLCYYDPVIANQTINPGGNWNEILFDNSEADMRTESRILFS